MPIDDERVRADQPSPQPPDEPSSSAAGGSLSRRRLLQAAAFGGVAAFLAACGSPAVPSTVPSPASESAAPAPSATTAPPASTAASPSPSAAPTATVAPTPTGPTLEEKIAGLMIVGFRGSRLDQTPWVRDALATRGLGGVILFDRDQLTGAHRNVLSPSQVKTLVGELRAAAGDRTIIVSVDQEGGL
ncbi:MAG TPA: twin-arginine translocation signal domain-containing protein, partial [Candidatus Limnocylindrales bacterium]|nr:twin-arginine translocation signal domain-containing protein [Candidatus Limnocylindrales bacterium]